MQRTRKTTLRFSCVIIVIFLLLLLLFVLPVFLRQRLETAPTATQEISLVSEPAPILPFLEIIVLDSTGPVQFTSGRDGSIREVNRDQFNRIREEGRLQAGSESILILDMGNEIILHVGPGTIIRFQGEGTDKPARTIIETGYLYISRSTGGLNSPVIEASNGSWVRLDGNFVGVEFLGDQVYIDCTIGPCFLSDSTGENYWNSSDNFLGDEALSEFWAIFGIQDTNDIQPLIAPTRTPTPTPTPTPTDTPTATPTQPQATNTVTLPAPGGTTATRTPKPTTGIPPKPPKDD